jgi:hypothetical protein
LKGSDASKLWRLVAAGNLILFTFWDVCHVLFKDAKCVVASFRVLDARSQCLHGVFKHCSFNRCRIVLKDTLMTGESQCHSGNKHPIQQQGKTAMQVALPFSALSVERIVGFLGVNPIVCCLFLRSVPGLMIVSGMMMMMRAEGGGN